jgi:hypothetical protein
MPPWASRNAVRANAGNYTVVVSNGSGSVTSSVATLTYTGNVAPVANPSTYSRPAGYPLNIIIAAIWRRIGVMRTVTRWR